MKAQLNLFVAGMSTSFAIDAFVCNNKEAFVIQVFIVIFSLAWYYFRNSTYFEAKRGRG